MNTKSAFIAIVGKPNVGKSSLLNALLGEKVAIVTDKPQTTRTKITGVLTKDETQYVFIDTPGLHKPKTKLSNSMVKAVSTSVHDVDVVIMLIDAHSKISDVEKELIASIKARKVPAILLINKIDLIEQKERIMGKILEVSALHSFDAVIPVSVLKNEGVDIILKEINKFTKESIHFFPSDTLTDQPERIIAAELIREKLLINLQQEIPHGTAVVIERMSERGQNGEGKRMMDIEATIFCEKKSHKGIIIGKQGRLLKKIGTDARRELEQFLDIPVNLQCWIKIKEDWRNRENLIKDFGLN